MDIQKIATYGSAAAVVGTGSIMGGGHLIDQQTGGPQKRADAQATELRIIVREEIKKAMWEAWPENTGTVRGLKKPEPDADYRETTPSK
tara:strand:+ start:443 stop:709 length:267 start_codon:yes stop_codon:yes gene_type:complete